MTNNYEVLSMRLEQPFGYHITTSELVDRFLRGTVQNKITGKKVVVLSLCTQDLWNDPLARSALEQSLIDEAKRVEDNST